MSFPGAILMGAQQRLLPISLPYRFFVAACLFHVVAWGLLALAFDRVAGYMGGPGPLLAVIHALTLGVLVMTAMGASFQMLPVATGRALRRLWPVRLAFWLFLPGVPVLLWGFHSGEHGFMAAGGALVTTALVFFAWMVGDVMWRSRGVLPLMRLHGWLALASLSGLVGLGLVAIFDMQLGFLAEMGTDRGAVGLAHLILAVFGFMGMLAFGYSSILVPMFALSPAPSVSMGRVVFAFSLAGLVAGVVGAFTISRWLLPLAAVMGLVAWGIHLRMMIAATKGGMRKNLGLSFVLVRVSWWLTPLALVLGGAAALDLPGADRLVGLFVFVSLFGWLLTFLLGILQRIIPFLAAMNSGKGGAMPRLSELAGEWQLKFHAYCHFSALALVFTGILTDVGLLVGIGALAGLAGAAVYLWFALDVLRRLLQTQNKTG